MTSQKGPVTWVNEQKFFRVMFPCPCQNAIMMPWQPSVRYSMSHPELRPQRYEKHMWQYRVHCALIKSFINRISRSVAENKHGVSAIVATHHASPGHILSQRAWYRRSLLSVPYLWSSLSVRITGDRDQREGGSCWDRAVEYSCLSTHKTQVSTKSFS